MNRIFLTGATGFIGSHLAQSLATQGYELKLLVRTLSPKKIVGRPDLPSNATLIQGTLTEPDSYLYALKESDVVIHLAADYRVGLANRAKQRQQMYQTNVDGSLILADAASKVGIKRFIYASTTAAFGETKYTFPDETHHHNSLFRCYYEETKHIAHQCLKARAEKGLPLVMAVLGGVFGEGDNASLTLAMKDFLNNKLPIQPDSTSRFQLCYINHVVNAFELLLQHPQPDSAYLFTGQDFAMPEVLSLLAKVANKPEPKKVAVNKLKLPAYLMDFLSRFGLTLPLSKEVFRIMDGSTYMYSSAKAQTQMNWSAGDTEQELVNYMKFLVSNSRNED